MNQRLFLSVLLLFGWAQLLAQQLITYPAPDSVRRAADFAVTLNGKDVFVYDNAVSAMTNFSFEGSVLVEITSTHDLRWVDIRPKNA